MLYIFAGPLHKELSRIARFMHESGTLKMYYDFVHITGIAVKRQVVLMNENDEEPTPFKISDLKILSIFIIWVILLVGACLAVLVEQFYAKCRKTIQIRYTNIRFWYSVKK